MDARKDRMAHKGVMAWPRAKREEERMAAVRMGRIVAIEPRRHWRKASSSPTPAIEPRRMEIWRQRRGEKVLPRRLRTVASVAYVTFFKAGTYGSRREVAMIRTKRAVSHTPCEQAVHCV